MSEQLAKIALKQAVTVAANLRVAASMLKNVELVDKIDGGDKGKTFIESLQKAILSTLTETPKAKSTLSLGSLNPFKSNVA